MPDREKLGNIALILATLSGIELSTENIADSLKCRGLFVQIYDVDRQITVHAAHMSVHIRRHFCPFATIRTLEFRFLPALKSHVLLHVAWILVFVTTLGTLISSLSQRIIPLLLHRILGVPVGTVAIGLARELNTRVSEAIITVRRGRSVKGEMLLQRHRVGVVGQVLLLLIVNNS